MQQLDPNVPRAPGEEPRPDKTRPRKYRARAEK